MRVISLTWRFDVNLFLIVVVGFAYLARQSIKVFAAQTGPGGPAVHRLAGEQHKLTTLEHNDAERRGI